MISPAYQFTYALAPPAGLWPALANYASHLFRRALGVGM